MAWETKYSHEAETWVDGLADDEWNAMMAAVDLLEEHGPSLRRPTVANIVSSRHKNMKELISFGGNLRALRLRPAARSDSSCSAQTRAMTGTGRAPRTSRSPTSSNATS